MEMELETQTYPTLFDPNQWINRGELKSKLLIITYGPSHNTELFRTFRDKVKGKVPFAPGTTFFVWSEVGGKESTMVLVEQPLSHETLEKLEAKKNHYYLWYCSL